MTNKEKKIAIGIFLTAFLLRSVIVLIAAARGSLQVWEYEDIANSILNGSGYAIKHLGIMHYSFGPPLYPLFSALVYYITNHSHLALGLAQAFFSSAVCVAIFGIGTKIFSRTVGLVAASMTILHPGLNLYVTKLHSFNIDVLILVLVVFALLKAWEKMSILWFILLGMMAGLCLLSRSTIFLFLPFAFIFFWSRSKNKEKLLKYMFLAGAIALVIIGPWLIRNYMVSKRFIFIQESGEVFWRGNNPGATGTSFSSDGKPIVDAIPLSSLHGLSGAGQDRLFWREGFRFIRTYPARFIVLTVRKFYYFWWFSPDSGIWYPVIYLTVYKILYAGILLFAAAGVTFALISKIPKVKEFTYLMLIFFITVSVTQSLFYIEGRHRLAIEPLLLIFSAYGIICLVQIHRHADLINNIV